MTHKLFLRGFFLRRSILWSVAAGAVVALFVFVPWRRGAAALELVALGEDGRFATAVRLTAAQPTTDAERAGLRTRVPILLAVRNYGRAAAQPDRLELHVPAHFRLTAADGWPLPSHTVQGSPLTHYELLGSFPHIEPGRLPAFLPPGDTIWLELALPGVYCVALSDSIPEFVPAPPPAASTLRSVRMFYSFEGGDLQRRQTGLLTVRFDRGATRTPRALRLPTFTPEVREPGVPLPEMSGLHSVASRHSSCGAPEEPLELFTSAWETLDGGRFFVLALGGTPRKYLFDLDRDGVVELEMWDPDGDGNFEARRAAQLPVPTFLLPPAPPRSINLAVFDSVPDDSMPKYHRFSSAWLGLYRARGATPDTARALDRFRPLLLGAPAQLARAQPRVAEPELLGVPLPQYDTTADPSMAAPAPLDAESAAGTRRERPRVRRLLGRPVEPTPPPTDTSRVHP